MAEVELKYEEKYYLFLDDLRESGRTNMFGAGPYLETAFNLPRKRAHSILADWMRTFEKRHS